FMKYYILCCLFVLHNTMHAQQALAPDILWDKTFGTSHQDYLTSVNLGQNGEFFLTGASQGGVDGDKSYQKMTTSGASPADAWLRKLDANGKKLWDTVYGSSLGAGLKGAIEYDGNVLLYGEIIDTGGDFTGTVARGGTDAWFMLVNGANGQKIWVKRLGT